MMDFQQIAALSIVGAAAALLVLRYARGRNKPAGKQCADCVAASAHGHAPRPAGPPPAGPPSAGPPSARPAPGAAGRGSPPPA